MTPQRRAVMETLATTRGHPTVAEIHAAVCDRLPDVARATAYRVLETLVELGLVRRVPCPSSALRYEAVREPHHHFWCRRCERLFDLPPGALGGAESLAWNGAEPAWRPEEIAILVQGACPECA